LKYFLHKTQVSKLNGKLNLKRRPQPYIHIVNVLVQYIVLKEQPHISFPLAVSS